MERTQGNGKTKNDSIERYQALFSHNTECVLEFDLNGNLIQGNPLVEKICGYSIEELKLIGAASIVVPECMDKKMVHTKKVVNGDPQEYEISIFHKNGNKIDINVKMIPVFVDNQLVGIFEIIKDLTESKKIEEYLRRADKVSVIGQLAAGIAHEIRNPLTTIKGFIQLAKSNLGEDYTNILLSEIDRINLIVSEFMILSKPHDLQFKQKDLKDIIINVINFLVPQTNLRNIQFTINDYPLPVMVNCEENQLKQVFINLFKNAIESMPQGGQIHVNMNKMSNEKVSVIIKDEGCGIPQHEVERLGEPFFTTKEEGTGLGFMICNKIIDNHGGSIMVESDLNKGTSVHIIIPSLSETN
jgi:PAS domain S-box-containing protein